MVTQTHSVIWRLDHRLNIVYRKAPVVRSEAFVELLEFVEFVGLIESTQ